MELLQEINEAGTTIIMVTHDQGLAQRAKRNIHILDGQISNSSVDSQMLHATNTKAEENTVAAARA